MRTCVCVRGPARAVGSVHISLPVFPEREMRAEGACASALFMGALVCARESLSVLSYRFCQMFTD